MGRARGLLLVALLGCCLVGGAALADTITGSASLQDDGSLRVDGETVRLFGIWIPQVGRSCSTIVRPSRCLPKAVLALSYRINGFVHCQPVQRLNDGSVDAYCSTRARRMLDDREDLGSWMLQNGLALARPDAPGEYHAMERLAEAQGEGFWGSGIFNVH